MSNRLFFEYQLNVLQVEEVVDEEAEIVTAEATMVLPMGHSAHGKELLLQGDTQASMTEKGIDTGCELATRANPETIDRIGQDRIDSRLSGWAVMSSIFYFICTIVIHNQSQKSTHSHNLALSCLWQTESFEVIRRQATINYISLKFYVRLLNLLQRQQTEDV